jgi:hypothetical protein
VGITQVHARWVSPRCTPGGYHPGARPVGITQVHARWVSPRCTPGGYHPGARAGLSRCARRGVSPAAGAAALYGCPHAPRCPPRCSRWQPVRVAPCHTRPLCGLPRVAYIWRALPLTCYGLPFNHRCCRRRRPARGWPRRHPPHPRRCSDAPRVPDPPICGERARGGPWPAAHPGRAGCRSRCQGCQGDPARGVGPGRALSVCRWRGCRLDPLGQHARPPSAGPHRGRLRYRHTRPRVWPRPWP